MAQKTGLDPEKVKKELEALFYAGVIFPKGDFNDRQYYRFARSVGQFHDASQAPKGIDVVKDREFYRLWHDFVMNEWYPDRGRLFAESPQPFARIIPAYKSIKDLPDILPSEDIREIFKAQRRIAVVPCSCRYRTTAVERTLRPYGGRRTMALFSIQPRSRLCHGQGSRKRIESG